MWSGPGRVHQVLAIGPENRHTPNDQLWIETRDDPTQTPGLFQATKQREPRLLDSVLSPVSLAGIASEHLPCAVTSLSHKMLTARRSSGLSHPRLIITVIITVLKSLWHTQYSIKSPCLFPMPPSLLLPNNKLIPMLRESLMHTTCWHSTRRSRHSCRS